MFRAPYKGKTMNRYTTAHLVSDIRTVAILALIFGIMLACGCAATVPLDTPQDIAPGERMDVTTDDAWMARGPALHAAPIDPFAGAGNLRDPAYLAQFGGR